MAEKGKKEIGGETLAIIASLAFFGDSMTAITWLFTPIPLVGFIIKPIAGLVCMVMAWLTLNAMGVDSSKSGVQTFATIGEWFVAALPFLPVSACGVYVTGSIMAHNRAVKEEERNTQQEDTAKTKAAALTRQRALNVLAAHKAQETQAAQAAAIVGVTEAAAAQHLISEQM